MLPEKLLSETLAETPRELIEPAKRVASVAREKMDEVNSKYVNKREVDLAVFLNESTRRLYLISYTDRLIGNPPGFSIFGMQLDGDLSSSFTKASERLNDIYLPEKDEDITAANLMRFRTANPAALDILASELKSSKQIELNIWYQEAEKLRYSAQDRMDRKRLKEEIGRERSFIP